MKPILPVVDQQIGHFCVLQPGVASSLYNLTHGGAQARPLPERQRRRPARHHDMARCVTSSEGSDDRTLLSTLCP